MRTLIKCLRMTIEWPRFVTPLHLCQINAILRRIGTVWNVLFIGPMRFILALLWIQLAIAFSGHADSDMDKAIDSIRAMQKDFIVCDADCPAHLALITLNFSQPTTEQDARNFEQCLSTLIAPDEILTNAHCVPSKAVHKYMRVIFPKVGKYPAEVVRVERVFKVSDTVKSPLLDYAVLKLNRSINRPAARLHPKEIAEGQSLNLFTHLIQTDPATGVTYVKLRSQNCVASSAIEPDGKYDVVLNLKNCITEEGDSGGPIFTPEGELAGVVWGGGQDNTFGLNLMCLPNPQGEAPKGKCVQSIELAAFRLVQTLAFEQIFEIQKFGMRAPVADVALGGKLFFSALSCFSKVPNSPVEIQQTSVFVDQRTLDRKKVPVEAETSFVEMPTTLVLQPEGQRLSVKVLNADNSHILSYRPERCP